VAVLYAGPIDEALALADALEATLATSATVVPLDPGADVATLLSDDRFDCLVYAPDDTGSQDGDGLLETVQNWQPDLPVVGYGLEATDALATALDRGASVDALATAVAGVTDDTTDDVTADSRLETVYRGSDAYYAVDEDWRIVDWDPQMAARTGEAPEDVVGEILWDEFPDGIETQAYQRYTEVMEQEEPATFEVYYGPGGYWVRVRAYPREGGGLEFYTRDITERKERERQIESANQQLAETLERIDDAFFAVDDDWEITYFNGRAEEVLDRDAADVLGTDLWEAFPDAVDTQFYEEYHEAIATQESTSFEAYFEPLGSWFEVRAYPGADGLSVYFRDVTAQRERERELRQKTRAIEKAPIGITISDPSQPDNPLVYVNEAFSEMTGYEPAEAVGRNCRFLQGPDTDPAAVAVLREGIDAAEQVSVELLNYRQDGTPFWNRVDISPVHDEDGELVNFVGFQQDVSERHGMERKLRALHETARELMLATDEATIAELAAEAAADVLGLDATVIWQYSEVDEALVPYVEADPDSTITEELPTFEQDSLAWDTFQAGEVRAYSDVTEEEPIHNPDTRVRSEILVPLGDFGIMGTGSTEVDAFDARDVDLFRVLATTTEAALVRAEREAQLQRQNDRLDDFVSVVSHDLRNPLQVAQLRLETYLETGEEGHLDAVERNQERMRLLIDDLLDLARQGETVDDPEQVHLSFVASQAWDSIDTAGAILEMSLSSTLLADAQRLQQLFENLFRNAVEHGGPDVTVEVGLVETDGVRDGFYVEDDGPGIPAADRAEVFNHGFSTTEDGTGFGLSIVESIAEAHGWTVTLTESESGGARFEFTGIASLTSTG
jgi:PAS domain S-box-containing protein